MKYFSQVFSIFYLLVIISILLLIAFAIVGSTFGNLNPELSQILGTKITLDNPANSTFALILAGITITLATSIIVPKYLLDQSVSDHLREIENNVKLRIEKKYLEFSDLHMNTTDAHISRMIGLLMLNDVQLNEKIQKAESDEPDIIQNLNADAIWAVGWSIRSFKNYLRIAGKDNLMGETVRFSNYRDLITQNINVIESVKERLIKSLKMDTIDSLDFEQAIALRKMIGQNQFEDEWKSLPIRTVKEIVDSEYYYSFKFDELGLKRDNDVKQVCGLFFSKITPVTILLIILLLAEYKSFKKDYEDLIATIVPKSSYKDDKRYKQKLASVIGKINSKLDAGLPYSYIMNSNSFFEID